MDRYPLGEFGARYYVRRPDWAEIGRLIAGRLIDACALAGVGAVVLEYAPAVLR